MEQKSGEGAWWTVFISDHQDLLKAGVWQLILFRV